MALSYKPWEDGPETLGLGSQIAASANCDPEVWEELRLFWQHYDWPE